MKDQSKIEIPGNHKVTTLKLQKLVNFHLALKWGTLSSEVFSEWMIKKKKSFLQRTIPYEHKDIYFAMLVLIWSQGGVSSPACSTTYTCPHYWLSHLQLSWPKSSRDSQSSRYLHTVPTQSKLEIQHRCTTWRLLGLYYLILNIPL